MNANGKRIWEARRRNFGNMPRLKHSISGQPFDWNKSEVVQWLSNNPKAISLVFEALKTAKAITFDRDTGEWKGCDTP
jgi:hypothetical protein